MSTADPFEAVRAGEKTYRYLVGGTWRTSAEGKLLDIRSPIDGEVVGRVQACSPRECEEAVENAHASYKAWNARSISDRAHILIEASRLMKVHEKVLTDLLILECGKPVKEAQTEVRRTADLIEYFAEEGRRYYGEIIWGDSFPGYSKSKLCLVTREPLGVVLAISPFNYPLNLSASKIAPALITGNSVVFKPATQGCIAAALMCEMFRQAGVPAGCLNFVTGEPSIIGDPLVLHPRTAMISFTGGTKTGDAIARKVGVKPMMMELGGKDACIVCEDADLDLAVKEIVKGAFGYSGQRCTGVKRVLVLPKVADEVLARVVEGAKKLVVGDPRKEETFVGPVITDKSATYIQSLIDDALAKKAKLVLGGKRDGRLFGPTIFDQVTREMRIAWEEPFGPVLPFIRVKNLDDAVEVANASEFGLQSCVFTRDIDTGFKVGMALDVGTVNINGADSRGPDHFPFLGVKNSGMMTQGVHYSIEAMTRDRGIVLNLREPRG